MATVSNRTSINKKTLSGIQDLNVDVIDTGSVSIGNITIQNNTISGVNTISSQNNSDIVIQGRGTGDVLLRTNNIDRVVVGDNGNINMDSGVLFVDGVNNRVGVNTSSPSTALDVSGNVLINGSQNLRGTLSSDTQTTTGIYQGLIGTGQWRLKFVNSTITTNDAPSIDFGTTSTAFRGRIEYRHDQNAFRWYTNGTARCWMDGFGQMALGGPNNPTSMLDLQSGDLRLRSGKILLNNTFSSLGINSSDALIRVNPTSSNVGIGVAPSHRLDVSGNVNVSSGSTYKINGVDVLSSTTLGSSVVSSSLTTVGTLNGLQVSGITTLGNILSSGVGTLSGVYSATLQVQTATFSGLYATTLEAQSATFSNLRMNSVDIGIDAGLNNQASNSVAIGYQAGQNSQGSQAVSIGYIAGQNSQGLYAIAIGHLTASGSQKQDGIALGRVAGFQNQGSLSIAIGAQAGQWNQGSSAIAIGNLTGNSGQGSQSIAIGSQAGEINQGINCIAVGLQAGDTNQGANSIAIGRLSGASTQGSSCVAIGTEAGEFNQRNNAVAIGDSAGYTGQGNSSIAIGIDAGFENQGASSIAIGANAGLLNQHPNSIILNATGSALNSTTQSACFINPIRQQDGISTGVLSYNTTSKEITYSQTLNFDNNVLVVDMVNNRVGINTATPSSSLSVIPPDPSSNFPLLDFRNTSNYGIYAQTDSEPNRGNTLRFLARDFNSGSITTRDVLTMRPEGRVGIGTATPSQSLSVVGNTTISGDLSVDTNVLRVDSTNNRVGINITSPTTPLDVSGNTRIVGNLSVENPAILATLLYADNANQYVGVGTNTPNFPLHIVSSGVEPLCIDGQNTIRSSIKWKASGGETEYEVGVRGTAGNPDNSFYIFHNKRDNLNVNRWRLVILENDLGTVGLGRSNPDSNFILDTCKDNTNGFIKTQIISFRVRRDMTATSIGPNTSMVAGGTVDWDQYPPTISNAGWQTSGAYNGMWRAPVTGYYQFTINCRFSDGSGGTKGVVPKRFDGTNYYNIIDFDDNTFWCPEDGSRRNGSFTDMVRLNAGNGLLPTTYNAQNMEWAYMSVMLVHADA